MHEGVWLKIFFFYKMTAMRTKQLLPYMAYIRMCMDSAQLLP